jgi:hypothetical protein
LLYSTGRFWPIPTAKELAVCSRSLLLATRAGKRLSAVAEFNPS